MIDLRPGRNAVRSLLYSPDRKAERPAAHLQDFRGVLQVDGYAGFER